MNSIDIIEVNATIDKIVIQPGKEEVQITLTVFNSVSNVEMLTRLAPPVVIHGIGRPEQLDLPAEDPTVHEADPQSAAVEIAVNQVIAAANTKRARKAK